MVRKLGAKGQKQSFGEARCGFLIAGFSSERGWGIRALLLYKKVNLI